MRSVKTRNYFLKWIQTTFPLFSHDLCEPSYTIYLVETQPPHSFNHGGRLLCWAVDGGSLVVLGAAISGGKGDCDTRAGVQRRGAGVGDLAV